MITLLPRIRSAGDQMGKPEVVNQTAEVSHSAVSAVNVASEVFEGP